MYCVKRNASGRVVAVYRADGTVVRFDGPPAPPAVPADLAAADEAVEDAA
jgi:hypothetical protein